MGLEQPSSGDHGSKSTMRLNIESAATGAKRAHVNMMTDTIVASLPVEGLRSVVRSILTLYPSFTRPFETEAKNYLENSSATLGPLLVPDSSQRLIFNESSKAFHGRIRCMLGCGLVYESIPMFEAMVKRVAECNDVIASWEEISIFLASVDGTLIQATTAIQKTLDTPSGTRCLTSNQKASIHKLFADLSSCRDKFIARAEEFPFERGFNALENLEPPSTATRSQPLTGPTKTTTVSSNAVAGTETFELGNRELPRLFCGLWQLSSPAWGTAPQSKVIQQFSDHVGLGFTAFDMADHYGDAEVVFGRFRQSCSDPDLIFGATKYCVFQPIQVTPEVIGANVRERCQRMKSDKVDLLQFHWQDYNDPQYLEALRILEKDERVSVLGLCNFDTLHMKIILESGIKVATNQVQFSLIDSRPKFKMGMVCEQYGVKLLTYGTLCGGWLADKWLGKAEPELFGDGITPSQRKYYEMILSWGDWSLFQQLLRTLSAIASKHSVSIANVATRWVLDHPFVGAVLVGSRMGVSERAGENFAVYGWRLDETDREVIEKVLKHSRREEMFVVMGDCGGEYR